MNAVCERCGDSGWIPDINPDGTRNWKPLMNDALPCPCGVLARKYAAEKAMFSGQTERNQSATKT